MPSTDVQPRELIPLDEASRAIASVRTIDEAKDLREKAEAVKAYARKARLGREILVEASVVRAEAERRLGEILSETTLAKASPGNQYTGPTTNFDLASCTLESLGISKNDSARLQRIAAIPKPIFDQHLTELAANNREVTTAGLLRLAKQHEPIEAVAVSRPTQSVRTCRTLSDLIEQGTKFATVYADPPWPYANQATRGATSNHYPSMSIDDICAEPVQQVAASNAHLHLWTTNAFLLDAFDVMEAWGFEYKSCFIWIKPQMGLGNYWRLSHEFLFFGVRGNLELPTEGKGVGSVRSGRNTAANRKRFGSSSNA